MQPQENREADQRMENCLRTLRGQEELFGMEEVAGLLGKPISKSSAGTFKKNFIVLTSMTITASVIAAIVHLGIVWHQPDKTADASQRNSYPNRQHSAVLPEIIEKEALPPNETASVQEINAP